MLSIWQSPKTIRHEMRCGRAHHIERNAPAYLRRRAPSRKRCRDTTARAARCRRRVVYFKLAMKRAQCIVRCELSLPITRRRAMEHFIYQCRALAVEATIGRLCRREQKQHERKRLKHEHERPVSKAHETLPTMHGSSRSSASQRSAADIESIAASPFSQVSMAIEFDMPLASRRHALAMMRCDMKSHRQASLRYRAAIGGYHSTSPCATRAVISAGASILRVS